jgi:hypothetical protein
MPGEAVERLRKRFDSLVEDTLRGGPTDPCEALFDAPLLAE